MGCRLGLPGPREKGRNVRREGCKRACALRLTKEKRVETRQLGVGALSICSGRSGEGTRPRFLESRLNYPTISGSTAIKFLILRITNLGIKERSWKQIYPWIS